MTPKSEIISEAIGADREREELELLFDIARTFDKHVELRTALGPLLSLLEVRAGLSWGMVTLLDRATGLLKVEEAYGLSAEQKGRGVYRLGEGLVGRVFESGIAIMVPDLSRETHFLNRAKTRTKEDMAGLSYYCVPIRSGGNVIGTLSAERRIRSEDIDAQMIWDRTFMEKVSSIIADSAKLRERIMEEQFRLHRNSGLTASDERVNRDQGGRVMSGSEIIGTSNPMRGVYEMLFRVAPSDATVLISGESGTGKELIAAEIHRLSKRVGAPLVKVNCAAIPESLIESELFGHEKGAFTGADKQRKGRFELAHKGTLFLDEVGELSPQVQVKLLRVLQERELERVGGNSTIRVDVRLIAATNRNLEEEVKTGRFREDLYYRLNVFPVQIPPLRERKSDIVLLADYFAEKYADKNGKLIKRISTPAIDLLTSYSWPGNVRELENAIERAVILSKDQVIHSYDLPPSLQSAVSTNTEPTTTLEAALSRLEKELIVEALKIADGNMAAAARRLGITERQMGLRVHHYGINWRSYRATKM
ncbi:Nif-specific regulatory protein [Treponema primitia ZAS-2]|uniref:Nif-specific regulatory protein n=1 Tax=Treponema primitia (strain ATCC BAA-887 / DSM 12427 / ZAS-2) TaxID=545694 RepID=F5YIW2_TREPZ|nr:sigma-54-dependent Fis family transcriptional regulator [Treponema primitia]AEF85553.1 Nif-specific regulatory protein [Treponema primitia ZAS-2]